MYPNPPFFDTEGMPPPDGLISKILYAYSPIWHIIHLN